MNKINKGAIIKQLKLLPGYILVVGYFLFTVVAIGWIIVASLSTTPEIFKGEIFAFESGLHPENYANALFKHDVASYFANSMLYTFASAFLIIVIAAPASYALARYNFFGNRVVQSLFISGLGIPIVMLVMPLFGLIANAGLTNNRAVLIVLFLGLILPFTTYYLLTFFQKISKDFAEAASIDGCGPIKTFWLVMLPLAQPGIITVTIFNFITIWNEYFVSLIFANDPSLRPVAVGLFNMINSMKYVGDWAGLFAAVTIVFLPTFILYLFLSEKIIAGVTAGGLKG